MSAQAKQLEDLIKQVRHMDMTNSEKEAQRRSFAFGNAKIENDRITKGMIDFQAEILKKQSN